MLSKKIISIPLILFYLFSFASPTLASWTIDLDPPSCGIAYNPTTATVGSNVTVIASSDDTNTGGSGISAITLSPTLNSCTSQLSSSPATLSCPWTAASNTTFTATVTDGMGNSQSCSSTFFSTKNNNPAFLKTTGGDIHSNTNINLPPGP